MGKNDYYENENLERIIHGISSGTYGSSSSRLGELPSNFLSLTPSWSPRSPLETDYEELKRLAQEEDDFKKIVDKFGAIARKAEQYGEFPQATEALREAHRIYVDMQKQVAMVFAYAGDFETAEHHLKNAHISVSGDIHLEPQITPKEAEEIFDTALKHVHPLDLARKVEHTANQGDVETTEKYIGLVFRAFELHGIIKIPTKRTRFDPEPPLANAEYQRYFRLMKVIRDYHMGAYRTATSKFFAEALGYALRTGLDFSDKTEIRNRLEGIKELALEGIRRFVPNNDEAVAQSMALAYFNGFLNPLFDELVVCRGDQAHELRTVFEPVVEQPPSYISKIIGARRRQTPTTALVPADFYREQVKRSGIPFVVGPFYERVFFRYHPEAIK